MQLLTWASLLLVGCGPETQRKPEIAALLGQYHLNPSVGEVDGRTAATIELRQDGTYIARGADHEVAMKNSLKTKTIEQGLWQLEQDDTRKIYFYQSYVNRQGKTIKNGTEVYLLDQKPPYTLRFYLSDPDSRESWREYDQR